MQTLLPNVHDPDHPHRIYALILQTADSYFQKAADIAATSSHALLRWTRSVTTTECSPAPFRFVQSPATFKRYMRYWSRLLCYLCRSYEPEASSNKLLILTSEQEFLREQLLLEAEELVVSEQDSTVNLECAIHRILFTLLKQYLPENAMSSPLLHFVACLGIDIATGSFRQPNTYTPILAGFIYCARLIVIYEAHTKTKEAQRNDTLTIFKTLHQDLLTATSEYPFGNILNLLGYGMKCCTRVKDPFIQWTSDHQVLFYHGQKFQLTLFRRMIHELSNIAYSIGTKYLGWQPDDLSQLDLGEIRDELGNRDIGYSFLHDIRNTAILNPRRILLRFLNRGNPTSSLFVPVISHKSPSKDRIVVAAEFEQLLQAAEIFLEILLILTQLSCGQPPRGTELLPVLLSNTNSHQRHVFIVNGEFTIITNYNKTQGVVGKESLILRTLPACIGKLWICYLAYTKPVINFAENSFHKMVRNEQNAQGSLPPSTAFHTRPLYKQITPSHIGSLLFHSRQQAWKSGRLSRLLRYYGNVYLTFDNLSLSVYRHLAISIYRKQLGHVNLVEDMRKELSQIPIAIRQAGHSRQTSRRHYATDIADFNLLDSQTMQLFQNASAEWHKHLCLSNHLPIQEEVPPFIYSRLNPPIGSKVPLRFPPHRIQHHALSNQQVSNHPLPYTHSFPLSIDHVLVSIPAGFQRQSYKCYSKW